MKYLGILVIALSFALVCSLSVASQPYDSTGASTESVLYTFTGGTDGGYPYSALVFDQAGNLYGTTQAGGTYSSGTVFELSPGTGGWTETVLYNFGGGSQDGSYPQGSLIMDASGHLYGTTFYGGSSTNCSFGCGTAFKLTKGGSGWTETVLHSFSGSDGQNPYSRLLLDKAGRLYGTTLQGGSHNYGVVYALLPGSGGSWKEVTVHNFTGGNDGGNPYAPLTIDSAGNLYGTTFCYNCSTQQAGLVFELSLVNGNVVETVLHKFVVGSGIGGFPEGGVVFDAVGNLYGTTTQQGVSNAAGGVFQLKHSGTQWTYKVLYGFSNGNDGGWPTSDLLLDGSGNVYGTAEFGGTASDGVVFKLTPTPTGLWKENVLYSFMGGSDGRYPTSALIFDNLGNIFGTTRYGGVPQFGDVFEVIP
jgi:uncharacterized repeat protein (TIGR03803 family)